MGARFAITQITILRHPLSRVAWRRPAGSSARGRWWSGARPFRNCRVRSGFLRPVLEPQPRLPADSGALILVGDSPRLVEIGRGQQAVAEQEASEVPGVPPLLPDEALQQLLVVGHRTFTA